jgi:tRNA nucleotidyltransferase (CCA-adding enzyme)
MIDPFVSAIPVMKALEDAGYEAHFVGGAVRDYILHRAIHDIDIATSATPQEMKRIFTKTVDIGIEHGTLLVLYNGGSYEITTYRAEEEYVDFRRPKGVAFIRSLMEDLKRRDFTMNAIAMDLRGEMIDPFKGQLAISERRIETVGNAEERFQEDALRIMRAVRFMSQLSFIIEDKTLKALFDLSHLLEKIAVERKRAEFEKLLSGSNRRKAIQLMLETNMFSFLPGFKNQTDCIYSLLSYECEKLNVNEMWSLFIYCLGFKGKLIEDFLRDWKLPLKQIKEIQHILFFLSKRFEKEWNKYDLYLAKKDAIYSVENVYNTLKGSNGSESLNRYMLIYQLLPIKDRREMDVTGSDLINWLEQKGGPWVKETLMRIEHAILEGKVENKKLKIKEWLLKCNQI